MKLFTIRVGCVAFAGGLWLSACATAPRPVSAPTPEAPTVKTAPAVPAGPALDPREARRLTRELRVAIDEYHRLLQDKSVEEAALYVAEPQRRAHRDGLWELVGKYRIESADILRLDLVPQVDGVSGKVKVERVLFERNSVTPERRVVWMTWHHHGDRWELVPQQRK